MAESVDATSVTDDKFVEIERSLVSEADSSCLVYAERYLAVTCLRRAFFFGIYSKTG